MFNYREKEFGFLYCSKTIHQYRLRGFATSARAWCQWYVVLYSNNFIPHSLHLWDEMKVNQRSICNKLSKGYRERFRQRRVTSPLPTAAAASHKPSSLTLFQRSSVWLKRARASPYSFAFQYQPVCLSIMDMLGKKERRGRDVKGLLKKNWILIATIASVILGTMSAFIFLSARPHFSAFLLYLASCALSHLIPLIMHPPLLFY